MYKSNLVLDKIYNLLLLKDICNKYFYMFVVEKVINKQSQIKPPNKITISYNAAHYDFSQVESKVEINQTGCIQPVVGAKCKTTETTEIN